MDESAHRAYGWEMRFDSGLIFRGMAGNTPFNPNNPPAKYGRPVEILLIPRLPHLPQVGMAIPPHAKTIVNRDVSITSEVRGRSGVHVQRLSGLCFRIGRQVANLCQCLCVDIVTGKVYRETYTIDSEKRHKTLSRELA